MKIDNLERRSISDKEKSNDMNNGIIKKNENFSLRKLIVIIVFSTFSLPILYFSSAHNMQGVLFISFIQLLLNIVVLKIMKVKLISLPIVFIIFSYVFNMGTLIVQVLDINVNIPFNPYTMFSGEIFFESCQFFIVSQFFLVIGMILISKNTDSYEKDMVLKFYEKNKRRAFRLGCFLLGIGIIPRLYIDMSKIALYLHSGYLATYSLNISGVLSIVAGLAQVGILLIIIASKEKQRRAKVLFIITIIYECIAMFSGNRIEAIVYILTLVYAYFNFVGTMKKKQVIQTMIYGYIGLCFINLIGVLREVGSADGKVLKIFTQSPIWSMFSNFGGTLVSLSYSILFFPSSVSYNYGKTYLYSPLIIIPYISKLMPNIGNQFVFIYNFPNGADLFLGGSYLGELYFNFGFYGVLGTIVVGMFVMFLNNKAIKYLKQKKIIKFGLLMIVFQQVIIWVRGYLSGGIRTVVYSFVLIGIIFIISKKRYQYKRYIL